MTLTESQAFLVHRTVSGLREALAPIRGTGSRIGVVPTMGAMHEGHLSLVRTAAADTDFVVVTIFVNPTQFAPAEDRERYPRQLAKDCELAQEAGAHAVFAPADGEMYPNGYATFVEAEGLSSRLEGEFRPTHFRGVATIVLKLINVTQAEVAYFGQKDGQQARIVRKMVDDLNVPITIRVMPTVRERDGLAMSSRNAYLTADQRREAVAIYRSLEAARRLVAEGERDAATVIARMQDVLAAIPGGRIDYAAVVDADTLLDVQRIESEVMAAVAVRLGTIRLIDNILIAP
jgi:pantoate--beta-alanine ligase